MLREGIARFRGIPYARPPVGELRFRAPLPVTPWSGVREAVEPAPIAPQQRVLPPPIDRLWRWISGPESEDCLALNVWTPAPAPARRPVMVWLHGGGFLFGSGSVFLYDGAELARRGDVVVVTLNYRLGAFGFLDPSRLGAPAGGSYPANLGLRDQLTALAWVRENIEAFGGDPEQITVFGESAGAMSIACLLAAPAARGLFGRAVLQSGAAHHVSDPDEAEHRGRAFLHALGLDRFDPEVLEKLPANEILRAQAAAASGVPARGRLPWQPTLDGDLLPRPPLDAVRDGEAAGVELVVGTNKDEWKIFASAVPRLRSLDEARLERRAERMLRAHGAATGAAEAIAVYRAVHGADASPYEIYLALRTDQVFRLPALDLLAAQAPHQPRVYAYRLDLPVPAFASTLGACHAADLPLVFATTDHLVLTPFYLRSRSARRLSERVQTAWAAFARRGSPAHAGVGPWPAWEPVARKTMILDRRCRIERAPGEAERRVWRRAGEAGP